MKLLTHLILLALLVAWTLCFKRSIWPTKSIEFAWPITAMSRAPQLLHRSSCWRAFVTRRVSVAEVT